MSFEFQGSASGSAPDQDIVFDGGEEVVENNGYDLGELDAPEECVDEIDFSKWMKEPRDGWYTDGKPSTKSSEKNRWWDNSFKKRKECGNEPGNRMKECMDHSRRADVFANIGPKTHRAFTGTTRDPSATNLFKVNAGMEKFDVAKAWRNCAPVSLQAAPELKSNTQGPFTGRNKFRCDKSRYDVDKSKWNSR